MKSIAITCLIPLVASCLPASAQTTTIQTGGPGSLTAAQRSISLASRGAGINGVASQDPFLGGVPSGEGRPGVIPLTLSEAIDRGLKYNLGLLLSEQDIRAARGARWQALADLLPTVTTLISETRQQLDLAAFGFSGLPGFPTIVGPFDVFDTRAYLSQPVLDFKAIRSARASAEDLKAANYSYRDARDLVVLISGDLYIAAVAGQSRVEFSQAQVKAAQAVYSRAADLKKAGVVPGIDVLRSQVELEVQQHRLVFFQNEFQKAKLNLARAIGLPVGQEFELVDKMPYGPPPGITFEQALDTAYRFRADYQRAEALVRAAQSAKTAAQGEALPSLHFDANYGDIGPVLGHSHGTFAVAASLRIPVFQGGRVRGEVFQADALLKQRRALLADLHSRIEYEVRTAFLDLKASGDQVLVAQKEAELATEQLQQAQDRFSAGVVNSVEVVLAEEALANAHDNYISSLYTYNLAKGNLARALGEGETAAKQILGGKN